MQRTQQPRTLRDALGRRGEPSDLPQSSGGVRRLSDYAIRSPRTLSEVRTIASLLQASSASEGLGEPAKSGCSGDKPCGCKSCGGDSALRATLTDTVEFQDTGEVDEGINPETGRRPSEGGPKKEWDKERIDREEERKRREDELQKIREALRKKKEEDNRRAAAAAANDDDTRDEEIAKLKREQKQDEEPEKPVKTRPFIRPDGTHGIEEVPLTEEERQKFELERRLWQARQNARATRIAQLEREKEVLVVWDSLFTNGSRRSPGPCEEGKREAVLPADSQDDCLDPPKPIHSPCPPFTEDTALSFCTFNFDGNCYKTIQAWIWDSDSANWITSGQVVHVGPVPCAGSAQKAGVIVVTTDCEPLSDSELAEIARTGPSRHPKHTGDAEWANDLPDCPCDWNAVAKIQPDPVSGESKVVGARNGWCNEGASRFHPGAASCFRSLVPLKPFDLLRITPGQQCCYDKNGKLITGGAGAGTPDKAGMAYASAANGDCMNDPEMAVWHGILDVVPFDENDIKEYHKEWPPNKGLCCPDNLGSEG